MRAVNARITTTRGPQQGWGEHSPRPFPALACSLMVTLSAAAFVPLLTAASPEPLPFAADTRQLFPLVYLLGAACVIALSLTLALAATRRTPLRQARFLVLVLLGGLALHTPAMADGAQAEAVPMASLLWSLRAMVGSWIVLMLVVCVLFWRGPSLQGARGRFALWACVLTLPLPWIAMISGWLALELGQPSAPATAVVQAAASRDTGMATMIAWGCAYAVLMIVNLKLSLRWLRMDPVPAPHGHGREPYLGSRPPRESSALVDQLAQRYQVGDSRPEGEALLLTDSSGSRSADVEKLRRSIARLRKERNALRKVLKLKRKGPDRRPSRTSSRREDPDPHDTQVLPVLEEVLVTRR